MTSIHEALRAAHAAEVNSLDAEVLLAHVLNVSRTYLFTHPEISLSAVQTEAFQALLKRARQGEPVAYLTGSREFWSLTFKVTPDTLIPRPETEALVTEVLHLMANRRHEALRIADLGTGSGAIAIALAHECPTWQITATDISAAALQVAKENAQQHDVASCITFTQGSWFEGLSGDGQFDVIVSNPPYIASTDPHISPAVRAYEPALALFAEDAVGLSELTHIITHAPAYLVADGYLLIEHGFNQAESVQQLLHKKGYQQIQTLPDLAGLPRITIGKHRPFSF